LLAAHVLAFKELEFLQRRINSTNRQFSATWSFSSNSKPPVKSALKPPNSIQNLNPLNQLRLKLGSVALASVQPAILLPVWPPDSAYSHRRMSLN
jgi:hypothetical protein